MTAEGVFPKVGGDPLYYSEVNSFAVAPTTFYAGSTRLSIIGSPGPAGAGLAFPLIGSLVFPAGSLTNPAVIEGLMFYSGAGTPTLIVSLSGVAGLTAFFSAPFSAGTVPFRFNILLGSPLNGFAQGYSLSGPQSYPVTTMLVDNYYPGSKITLLFENNSANSGGFVSHFITASKAGPNK